jgi:hypothetical protein
MKQNIYKLIFEQESIDTPESSFIATDIKLKARKALDSIDDQVDALILRYEASSIRETSQDNLQESLENKTLKYIFEQDEEELPEDPPAEASGDESPGAAAPDPVGSEKMDVKKPSDNLVPDLDIDAFAARTVRLITNYKSLLRIEEAIINRVKHFLDENYGDKFVQRYTEILENQFGLTVAEFEDTRKTKDDNFAIGAYAGGTGGLGGGG